MAEQMRGNLARDGFQVLPSILAPNRCEVFAEQLATRLCDQTPGVIRSRSESVVGGRNLQSCWPDWCEIVRTKPVQAFLANHLGDRFGLVRILYFDKPPGQTWHLALHRDGAIAVEKHHDPPAPYNRPNKKAGVPHVQADDQLLQQMLTLRLHLDAMHADNGPLTVVPGSHDRCSNKHENAIEIHCNQGDVFAMRPLLLHGSRSSAEDNRDHRRVVHMEFAPHDALAYPYRWFRYDEASILRHGPASPT